MRRAVVLALTSLLLVAPADAGCVHVVTDKAGDAWAGAVPDPAYDALSADIALTPTTIEVVVALGEVDLAPGRTHRVVWTGFDLGDRRFYVEHRTQDRASSAMLLTVTEEWPETPTYNGASPMFLDYAGRLATTVDRAHDSFRVSVPLRAITDNGGTVARGTVVGRIDVTTWLAGDDLLLFSQARADDAQRPRGEPYRLGDPSCA